MRAKNKPSGSNIRRYMKNIILATNVLAIILLLLSTLAWYIMPSKFILIAYLGLGFPFILFLNIAFLIFWSAILKWKYALAQFIVFILFWIPISTYFPLHLRKSEIPDNSIKVLSYNVRAFNWETGKKARKNPILDYIAKSNADIVCLQEFAVSTNKNKTRIISQEEVNSIMKRYPYRSVIRLGSGRGSNIYGIACYSKFPILRSTKMPIGSTYNGSAIHEIDVNGKTVSLVNNHLESNRITAEDKKMYKDFLTSKDNKETIDDLAHKFHNRLGVAFKIREKQVKIIKEHLDKEERDATIICGDFNDTPISYTYKTMKGDMVDSYANTGFGHGITYHENKFLVRIDFIFHSQNMESYNCTVDKINYSDHYPIWTYLRFK